MLTIAAGVFMALCLFKALEIRLETPRQPFDPRRKWKRPHIVRCATEAEDRVVLIALLVTSAIIAGFVLWICLAMLPR